VVAVVTVIAIVGMAVGGVMALRRSTPGSFAVVGPTPSPSTRPITASSTLTAARGLVVFTDDFHDPGSGWKVENSVTDGTYSYSSTGYIVVVSGAFDFFSAAPYGQPHEQMSASVTATVSATSPPDAGFGVDCVRPSGTARLRYQFVVIGDGQWFLQRRDASTENTGPTILRQGSSFAAASAAPLTLVGMCATLADGTTTRLAMFLNGAKVLDTTDTGTSLLGGGWFTDLNIVSSQTRASTVTVTRFEVRDITHS
jgi:hypothetical protein